MRDPAKLAVLAEIAGGQKHIQQCPIFLVWLADLSRNARLAEEEKTVLEGMPYLESFLVASIDAALAAQNAVVAAESLGLSTVYIGALRNDVVRVAETLGLPPGVVGVFGLCVGYATDAAKAEVKPRLPQANVLHHDTYDHTAEPAQRAAYDAADDRLLPAERDGGRYLDRPRHQPHRHTEGPARPGPAGRGHPLPRRAAAVAGADLPRPVFSCRASIRREASALLSSGSNSSPASSDRVLR